MLLDPKWHAPVVEAWDMLHCMPLAFCGSLSHKFRMTLRLFSPHENSDWGVSSETCCWFSVNLGSTSSWTPGLLEEYFRSFWFSHLQSFEYVPHCHGCRVFLHYYLYYFPKNWVIFSFRWNKPYPKKWYLWNQGLGILHIFVYCRVNTPAFKCILAPPDTGPALRVVSHTGY